ncbi:hypothetical protein [Microbacterium aureliae]
MTASELIEQMKKAGTHPEPPPPPGTTPTADDECPIIEDLRAIGVDTNGVHHLHGKADQHPGMRDILFEHLGRDYSEYIRSRMAAALGGKKASDAEFARLVAASRAETSDRVRQQFAAAIDQSAGGRIDEVIELIGDPSLGRSRVLLISALRRSRRPEAKQALESLRSDPILEAEIRRRLKK